jgi:hypothetical protein
VVSAKVRGRPGLDRLIGQPIQLQLATQEEQPHPSDKSPINQLANRKLPHQGVDDKSMGTDKPG